MPLLIFYCLWTCALTYSNAYRTHDHDEVVWKHPFSSGKPISNDESKPKKKRINHGCKYDYSGDDSADRYFHF